MRKSTLLCCVPGVFQYGSPRRYASLLGAALLFGLTMLAFANTDGSFWLMKPTVVSTGESAVLEPQNGRTETELITITSTGFEPSEIARPSGKFFLQVDNRSAIEEVELHLDREGGGREKSTRVTSSAPEWRTELDLLPGVYILSETNHSSWICRITITAN